MKVIKIIGFVVIALVVIIVFLGLIAPKTYEVERSIVIDAPRNQVFYHVQYWNNWKDWSPWAKRDSTMQITVEGADGAEGSLERWTGEKAGKGEMINTGVKLNERIDYYGPYEKSSRAHFAVELYFSKNNLIIKPPVIEEYLTDPTQEPNPAKWLTRIYNFAE